MSMFCFDAWSRKAEPTSNGAGVELGVGKVSVSARSRSRRGSRSRAALSTEKVVETRGLRCHQHPRRGRKRYESPRQGRRTGTGHRAAYLDRGIPNVAPSGVPVPSLPEVRLKYSAAAMTAEMSQLVRIADNDRDRRGSTARLDVVGPGSSPRRSSRQKAPSRRENPRHHVDGVGSRGVDRKVVIAAATSTVPLLNVPPAAYHRHCRRTRR